MHGMVQRPSGAEGQWVVMLGAEWTMIVSHFRLLVRYVPNQKRRRRNKEKFIKNKQELMLFRAPESCFHSGWE